MKKEIIYLDHAAATPLDGRVLAVMQPYFSEKFYNPSSPYSVAVEVKRDYEAAKASLAHLIGAKSGDLVMSAGATESINLAFGSVSGHVVTSKIEHQSVLACAGRHEHTLVDVDSTGLVDIQAIKSAILPNTELVSITLANNEIGTVEPIRAISEIVKKIRFDRLRSGNETPLYLHTDASQGAGQLDVNVSRLGVDMLTLNAAKVYGPKQVGLLWVSSRVKLTPQVIGGGQERGLRSGTENVAGVIGFAKAMELACDKRESESKRLAKLRDKLQDNLQKAFPSMVVSGNLKHRLSGFLHVSFPGLDGERLVFLLEDQGVMVATGSACAANKGLRSHVLGAIGLSDEESDGSIRISLGKLSNNENIALASEILIKTISGEYKRVGRA